MIYSPVDYVNFQGKIPKARALAELCLAGFPVPLFIIITQDEFKHGVSSDLIKKIIEKLPVNNFAVRFAAMSEDTIESSAAGKFNSKIGVSSDNLEYSIKEVLSMSIPKLTNLAYVVIIQKAIDADVSGVIFSRDPNNSRFMQLEYGSGTSAVVTGDSLTETLKIRIGTKNINTKPKFTIELSDLAMKIEKHFNFPQDIEWCVKDDSVHILQSRPISTYTEAEWKGIKLIDQVVKSDIEVYLKKSEGMETYDNITPLDLSVLEFLHKKDGAINQAYKDLGMHYCATNQYLELGNTLYINLEREQQQLLLSYYLAGSDLYKLSYFPLGKLIRTATNYVQLKKDIPSKIILTQITKLQTYLHNVVVVPSTVDQALDILTTQYKTIFLLNYLIRQNIIDVSTRKDSNIKNFIADLRCNLPVDLVPGKPLGNSLALADDSNFVASKYSNGNTSDELREVLRWQCIKLRQMLNDVFRISLAKHNINSSLLHFFTIESYRKNNLFVSEAEDRIELWKNQQTYKMPEIITTYTINEKDHSGNVVLSAGIATGTLVRLPLSKSEVKFILYTETLTPQIISHYKDVGGVICRYGGMLSHAAIVAREMNIPVIQSGIDYSNKIGQVVLIDTSDLNNIVTITTK